MVKPCFGSVGLPTLSYLARSCVNVAKEEAKKLDSLTIRMAPG
jgi:hypothetical protein